MVSRDLNTPTRSLTRHASSLGRATRLLVAVVLTQLTTVALAASADTAPTLAGLTVISQARWTPTAVRKVLRTFAFGGDRKSVV